MGKGSPRRGIPSAYWNLLLGITIVASLLTLALILIALGILLGIIPWS